MHSKGRQRPIHRLQPTDSEAGLAYLIIWFDKNHRDTVDERNPKQPPGMEQETLYIKGYLPYQLVQDFFHEAYERCYQKPWNRSAPRTWVPPPMPPLPENRFLIAGLLRG